MNNNFFSYFVKIIGKQFYLVMIPKPKIIKEKYRYTNIVSFNTLKI